MATYILGDFARLYIKEFGSTAGWQLVGCTTGDTFNPTSEVAEITNPTADYVEVIPTYKSATLSCDTLLILAPGLDSVYAATTLIEWQKADQKLDFLYTYTDGTYTVDIEGACYITSMNISASSNDYVTVQIAFQCTGEWSSEII